MALDVDVTLLNIGNNTTYTANNLKAYMEALHRHFSNNSTKFGVKQGTIDAFTVNPADTNAAFDMNLRWIEAQNVSASMDTNGNLSGSGTDPVGIGLIDPTESISAAGDSTTAPTVDDGTSPDHSGEYLTYEKTYPDNFSGISSISDRFYIIELPDCFFVVHMEGAETINPMIMRMGRDALPYYNGIAGGLIMAWWANGNVFDSGERAGFAWHRVQMSAGLWGQGSDSFNNELTTQGSGSGYVVPTPFTGGDDGTNLSNNKSAILSKYSAVMPNSSQTFAGNLASSSGQAYVYVDTDPTQSQTTSAHTQAILPWDALTNEPVFA